MATPIIFKGDDTDFNGGSSITLNVETTFNLDGCSAVLTFLGFVRDFPELSGRSAQLEVKFTADETEQMEIGTHRATLRLFDSEGRVRTVIDDIRMRVTDSVAEAYGVSDEQEISVTVDDHDPSRLMQGQTLRTNTPNALRQAVKAIAQALGATVSVLAVAALTSWGASVQTAPLGELDLDQNPSVVTNVDLSGLLTAHQDISGKADKTNTYTKAETDAKIVELSPPTSLEPSTNYTDAALGAFASTGAVARVTDGTNAIDAARNVYMARGTGTEWRLVSGNPIFGSPVWQIETGYYWPQPGWYVNLGNNGWTGVSSDYYATRTSVVLQGSFDGTYVISTNEWERVGKEYVFVGKLALTNDLPSTNGFLRAETDPNVPSWAKASSKPSYSWGEITGKPNIPTTAVEVGATTTQDVERIIREKSLGGIWDGEVWWTPVMLPGGCLTYQATTNVNMEANQ